MEIIEARGVSDKSIIEKGEEILREKLSEVLDTHVITDGDKTYVAAHEDAGTVGIVRETKYGPKPIYFFQNYSRVDISERFEDESFDYYIDDPDDPSKVALTELHNRNEYILTAIKDPKTSSPTGITFGQYDASRDATLEYQFYVNEVDTLEAALEYSQKYFPGFIRAKRAKMVLDHFEKVQRLYAYKDKSEKYYSPITIFNKYIIGTSPFGHEPEKLITELCEGGFYTSVPDELVNLMLGKHKIYNELKEIEKAYKRHI